MYYAYIIVFLQKPKTSKQKFKSTAILLQRFDSTFFFTVVVDTGFIQSNYISYRNFLCIRLI